MGRALRGVQEVTVESPVRFRVSSQKQNLNMKKKRSVKNSLERHAGHAVMDVTEALMKYGNSVDVILERYVMEYAEEDLEKSTIYQVLKAGRKGMQRTLDEMNDVLNKFGFKE